MSTNPGTDLSYSRDFVRALKAENEELAGSVMAAQEERLRLLAEVEQLQAALERIKRESGNPGFAPSAIARAALEAVRG